MWSSDSPSYRMTLISGRRAMARSYAPSSDIGSSTATTSGCSRRSACRIATANSSRPGSTGKYFRFSMESSRSHRPRVAHRLVAKHLLNRVAQRLGARPFARGDQLRSEARKIDAVADGVALVGRMGHLQEVRYVLQDAVFGKRQVLFQNAHLFIAFGKIEYDLRLKARMDVLGQVKRRGVVLHRC